MIKYNAVYDKIPCGAVTVDEAVTMSFTVSIELFPKSLTLILRNLDGEHFFFPFTMKKVVNREIIFEVSFSLSKAAIYYYRFEIVNDTSNVIFVGANENLDAVCGDWLPEFQLTVCEKRSHYPSTNCGIIYHIFVDRFYKSEKIEVPFTKRGKLKNWTDEVDIQDELGNYDANDFFGGNLYGIAEKIDYFKKLGVTHLYLSPIFESGSNHRYDTGDYMKIDDLLGGEAGFQYLLEKTKSVGIGIILDGVFNHSGADSIFFNKFNHYDSIGAFQSKKSPYYHWFTFQQFPEKYTCWWGMTCVPTFNKHNHAFIDYVSGENGVIEKWLKYGLAGWRLDVVDEFSSEFMDKIVCAVKKTDVNALIIGEVWEDASVKVSYSELKPYFTKCQLDGVMNYVYKEAIIDYVLDGNAQNMCKTLMQLLNNYPHYALKNCMTLLGSHDTIRILNRLASVSTTALKTKKARLNAHLTGNIYYKAISKVKMAAFIQYTIMGTPTIYYGDEIGMQGYEDPINRRPFTWDKIHEGLRSFYQKLGEIRMRYNDVFCGDMYPSVGEDLLVYTRAAGDNKIVAIINNTTEDRYFSILGKSLLSGEITKGNLLVFSGTYDLILQSKAE